MNTNVGKVLSVEDLFERNHSGTNFHQRKKLPTWALESYDDLSVF